VAGAVPNAFLNARENAASGVVFGRDDAFLTPILKLLKRLPFFPIFGNGQMRLQPVYVEDVGQAIAKIMQSEPTGRTMFECGGPRV
jgi:nucleoside-diphosphate-sugar epimerase